MTQKEKQLLLKDLCARLPYGVKVNFRGYIEILREVHIYKSVQTIIGESGMLYDINMPFVKPYFRPMSSMTEEEKKEYHNLCSEEEREQIELGEWITKVYYHNTIESIDWLNEYHFDYRGLIEKGLALEAPEGMYKTE